MQPLASKTGIASLFATALAFFLVLLFLLKFVVHSWRAKREVSNPSLVGQIGKAESDVSASGMVFVCGELWHARSRTPIKKGERVRVVGCHEFTLEVEAED